MNIAFKRGIVGALIFIAGTLIVPRVAVADATQIIVRCALAQACSSTKNTVGAGVQGITAGTKGPNTGVLGLDGSSNGGINSGVLGVTTNGGFGVDGFSSDGAYGGVRGTATTGVGVEGVSSSFWGIYGRSATSVGVVGTSGTNLGLYGSSGSFTGVYGTSGSGYAVQGVTSASDAGHFSSTTGTGVRASSVTGFGLVALTGGSVGAYVVNSNGNGADVQGSYVGLLGRSNSYPLLLTNAAAADVFFVDGSGNVYSHGTYRTFVATRQGRDATAYSTATTTPSVEDSGTAELIDGAASVRFDPAFAASIDLQTAYQVFLTPGGDTRGLFIASKTANGFVVRETQGGRGRLSFDYRIIARALGHTRERMAFVNPQTDVRPKAPAIVYHPEPATRVPTMQLPRKRASTKAL